MSIIKKKKEKGPQSPTLPEVESASPATPDPQIKYDDNEANESVEPSVKENEGSPQSKQQIAGSRNFSHGGELRLTNSGSSIGHHTDESLAEARRPRVSSTASSVQSYTTAHGSPLPSRATGKRREEEVMNLFSTMKDELLQSMREIRDKMSKLEGKMDGIEKTFESRMAEVEKQIQSVRSDIQSFQTNGTVTGEIALSPSRLAPLPEVGFQEPWYQNWRLLRTWLCVRQNKTCLLPCHILYSWFTQYFVP